MASWMLHLRIADALLTRFPQLEPTQFVAGNLAPDSGRMNADRMSYTPTKQLSHWKKPKEQGGAIQDELFAQRYLHPLPNKPETCAFHLGYYAHLLTDQNFIATVFRPLRDKRIYELPDATSFSEALKKDWYQTDLRYFAQNPELRSYHILQTIRDFPNSYFDYFAADAFTKKLREIQKAYRLADLDPAYSFSYSSCKDMDDFVEREIELVGNKIAVFLG